MSKKLKNKAVRWGKILGLLPGVRAIFLSGSLATGDSNQMSDIDIFIITKSGQIWTARFFVFITLKITNQLAKPEHHDRMICPNHFITEDMLEIQEQDKYAAYLFSQNIPLYDPKNIFPQFMVMNQEWFKKFRYNLSNDFVGTHCNASLQNKPGPFEKFLKNIQIKRIKNNPEYKTHGAKIVLTDTELRFHPKPKNKTWKNK